MDNRKYRQRDHDKKRNYLLKLKDVPCMDCEQRFPPECMDFDHRYGKIFNLSKIKQHSFADIVKEAAKCDVVCANCHRIRTKREMWLRLDRLKQDEDYKRYCAVRPEQQPIK